MSDNLLIITEANKKVASGHLMECIVCYDYLKSKGCKVSLLVNEDMPETLKTRLDKDCLFYESNIQEESKRLLEILKHNNYNKIIFNLRKIENFFLVKIKECYNSSIICIDEFGNRALDAEIIINPMIDKSYWQYETSGRIFCGLQYLILPLELQKYHIREKAINKEIKTITISMGGVDIVNSTHKLVTWLRKMYKHIHINVVLGGGYSYEKMLNKDIVDDNNISVYKNINNLSEIFFNSDLAFCAGGNTLHELAVIGVPTIVVPSMPHEVKNGKAYETKGFSYCTKIADEICYNDIKMLFDKIRAYDKRQNMSIKGKLIADGKGYMRVYNIITE